MATLRYAHVLVKGPRDQCTAKYPVHRLSRRTTMFRRKQILLETTTAVQKRPVALLEDSLDQRWSSEVGMEAETTVTHVGLPLLQMQIQRRLSRDWVVVTIRNHQLRQSHSHPHACRLLLSRGGRVTEIQSLRRNVTPHLRLATIKSGQSQSPKPLLIALRR